MHVQGTAAILFTLALIVYFLTPLFPTQAQANVTFISSEEQTESLPDASTVEPLDPRDFVPAIDIDEQELRGALAMARESQRGGYRSRHHHTRDAVTTDDAEANDPAEAAVNTVANVSEIVAIFTGIGLATLVFCFLKSALSS